MHFLFVDRILALEEGKRTLAIKHVTASDFYLSINTKGRPRFISCMIGEALGQVCSWNVMKSTNFRLCVVGGIVENINILDDVYVGETLILESYINVLDLENQVVNFHGVAKVGERTILEVQNVLGPLLPITNFDDPLKIRENYQHLYRPGPVPKASKINSHSPFTDLLYFKQLQRHLVFDTILNWERGKEVTAQKNISLLAPYFIDHFPKQPVLPLCLLLECKLQLAYSFLKEIIDQEKGDIQLMCISRIKMSEFVKPGDSIITRMILTENQQTRFVIQFRSEVEGKRICLATAEFEWRSL